ncbi:hypothetical protein D1871_03070 [Nakamurella silvestris]|nr:hypothetical protein D1871_03070 [Nakamurella silvestris]
MTVEADDALPCCTARCPFPGRFRPARTRGVLVTRTKNRVWTRLALAVTVAVPLAVFAQPTTAGAAPVRPVVEAAPALAAKAEAAQDQSTRNTIWFNKPATNWETESLPLGNGALGISVFGGLASEQLTFNEKTLWTGGPGAAGYNFGNWTTPRPTAIKDIQNALNTTPRMTPQAVANALGQPKTAFGSYNVFGNVFLDMPGAPTDVQNYRRSLDISKSLASVSYSAANVNYQRQYFVSSPDNVVVAKLSADQAGKVGFTLRITAPTNRSQSLTSAGGRMTFKGALNDNGLKYEYQAQVIPVGGTLTNNANGTVTVAGADSAVIVMGAGTNYSMVFPTYRTTDPAAKVTAAVNAAAAKSWDTLFQAHETDYTNLFGRVDLDLNATMPDIPTPELLARYRNTSTPIDPAQARALEALYFQYGRYLLVSSSRAGSLPANLQGIWNNVTNPPWDADYHVNINMQMNYWPAETTNLSETTAPFFDYVDSMVAPGTVTASTMYNSRGWVVNNETNPYGFTGLHNYPQSFWQPDAAAWLARHYFEHYQFTGDQTFLTQRAYPLMKSIAQFWFDFLIVDPRDGKLVVSPSYSPENGDFSAGASISQQIVTELLANTQKAADILGENDSAFLAELASNRTRLDPGLRVGSWGQLQEWKLDWDNKNDTHRHVSHLFALFPGDAVSPATTPALANAAKVSLEARGDAGTGWSMAWKVNFWARLLDGDRALKLMSEQLKSNTLDNLWDTHPPFQIDGNFGGTSGVAEMLLQSQTGVVDVLPALPSAWAKGSYTGLKARGDVTVGAKWEGGSLRSATLTPAKAGVVKVRNSAFAGPLSLTKAGGAAVAFTAAAGVVTFTAEAGQTYTVAPSMAVTVTAPAEAQQGDQIAVTVGVSSIGTAPVPAGVATLTLPAGWTSQPASVPVAQVPVGGSATAQFTVTVGAGTSGGLSSIIGQVTVGDAAVSGRAAVKVRPPTPCPVPSPGKALLAWDLGKGVDAPDLSLSGRPGTVSGGALISQTGPTGNSQELTGNRYITSASTSLGFLWSATLAAEVNITSSSSYRRLWDYHPPSSDTGIMIDLTPSGTVRVVTAGVNNTVNAVLPTGRFINLVVVLGEGGAVKIYVDGVQVGSTQVPSTGYDGCGPRPFRFGGDQSGGQRLTGFVDRIAVIPRALEPAEVTQWQQIAFVSDEIPPVTTAVTAPAAADGDNGWFRSPVQVTLAATDNVGGSGVVKTEYRINGGDWAVYAGAIPVTAQGSTTVGYRSTDAFGNVETATSLVVKLDSTPPVTAPDVQGSTITLHSADNASEVARTEYRIGTSGTWLVYGQPFTVTAGPSAQTVQFRSTDKAGNVEGVRSLTVPAAPVVRVPTTVSATVPTASAPVGSAVKVKVTVGASSGTPTGMVVVEAGGVPAGAASLVNGVATVNVAVVSAGSRALTVRYVGSATHLESEAPAGTLLGHFTDLAPGRQFYTEVMWGVNKGITTGNPDGTFRPNAPVTRQAFAAMLYRLEHNGGTAPACTATVFTDVKVDTAFCGEIKWMVEQGYATGWSDGSFRPAQTVSRLAVAAFLYRYEVGGKAPACTTKPFTDIPVSNEFCGEVKWLVASGIAQGFADNTYRPNDPTDRAAAVVFLSRL